MIQINELRIGNYIEEGKVEKIDNSIDEIYYSGDRCYLSSYCNNINPIPLTEEWLLKFGFENVHTDWFYKDIEKTNSYQFCFNICLSNGKITLDSGFDENSIIKLKYVHQLQNLYFALTGSELTVA